MTDFTDKQTVAEQIRALLSEHDRRGVDTYTSSGSKKYGGMRDKARDAIVALVEGLDRRVQKLEADKQSLRSALLGYHKAASASPFAQWSTEQHAAEIVLEKTNDDRH